MSDWVYDPIVASRARGAEVTNEQPNPSWPPEKMVRYLEEKYGQHSKYTDAKAGRRLTWDEVVKLWDSAGLKP